MADSPDLPQASMTPGGDEPGFAYLPEGTIVAERYRVESLLGEGGMGAVYRVQHVHMHKVMALKVLHPEMMQFPEVVARFEREAIASGRIEHDNVIVATDFGRLDDGAFFLVLEFAAGRSLREAIHAAGTLSPQRCSHIGRQVASALGAAHTLGIVHRDLKPENVMLIARDGDPDFVKVLDFGIAKMRLDEAKDVPALTRVGAVFGTPEYMSPEQALGQTVDARSDLYALGVLLYEMATGRVPFASEQAVSVLAQQITAPPPPLPSSVPADLAALIEKLLAKDVHDRVQTAADVVRWLDAERTPSSVVVVPPATERASLHSDGAGATLPTAIASVPNPTIREAVPAAPAVRVTHPSVGDAVSLAARNTLNSIEKLGPALKKPVQLGAATFPTWMPIAGAGALVGLLLLAVGLTVVALSTSSGDDIETASGGLIPKPVWTPPEPREDAPDLTPAEIDRIEAIALYKRTADDWMALGRAYSEAKRFKESASAYRTALQSDRGRKNDPQLLADMRMAARDPDAYPLVLNVAEGRRGLGEVGLDLLWDVWRDLLGLKQTEQAETTLKKLLILSRRASKALRVAIELQTTSRCDKVAEVLSRASQHADSRALPRLQEMSTKTSCSPTSSEECFACLLGSPNLARALDRAQKHPAPTLERGYR